MQKIELRLGVQTIELSSGVQTATAELWSAKINFSHVGLVFSFI